MTQLPPELAFARRTRRVVRLPAHGFADHPLQRIFLTRRQASRMTLPGPLEARRALARTAVGKPAVPPDERYSEPGRVGWALASVALMVLAVALAVWATGVR